MNILDAPDTNLISRSEMGRRIITNDWAKTPLGPLHGWPQSLRSAVRIMLTSRYAMWMAWGPELTFLCNDAYLPTVGIKRDWVLGERSDKVWQEIWPEIGPRIQHVLATGEATWDERLLLFLERSGFREETYHTFSYSPLFDDAAAIAGMLCVVTEVTEREVGERRLALLRDLGTGLAGARDKDEVLAAVQRSLCKENRDIPFACVLLVDGKAASDTPAIICGGDQQSLSEEMLAALRRAAQSGETIVLPADHGPDAGPCLIEHQKALIVPIVKQAASANFGALLIALNPFRPFDAGYRGFIDLLVAQIAAGLASSEIFEEERRRADALAELDRAKTAFFANVSHEFRTPLTLMLGPLSELKERLSAPGARVTALEISDVDTAHHNSLRLLRLVNSLLDFSRIEAGRMEAVYRPTALDMFTADLASLFRSAIEKAGLTFIVDCPSMPRLAYVDHAMWEKIVLNLLSNAFKFTFEGSIELKLRDAGDFFELSVRDTGTGIQKAQVPRIFERFHRVEGASGRTHEGTGIGLALVQELVRLHGGDVTVESEEGRGSTFRVRIRAGYHHLPADSIPEEVEAPVVSTTAAFVSEADRWMRDTTTFVHEAHIASTDEAQAASSDDPTRSARIIVADDNADMRAYLERQLSARWQVETVSNGLEALVAIARQQPDLVISDVMMPELDGFQLLGKLREDPSTATLPVILLSARAGEEARVEGLNAGADDYIVKPFSARELLARVASHLQLQRVRREASEAIAESEAKFRHMADHAPVMIWVTEPAGLCTFLSKSWYEFTGQRAPEGLGEGWVRAVHPEDRIRIFNMFKCANKNKESFKLEYRLRHRSGAYHWVIDAASPYTSADGTFLGYIGSVFDISERKVAEEILQEREATLRAYYDHVPVYMGIVEPTGDGDILHIYDNKVTCQFFGVGLGQTSNRLALKELGADPTVVAEWLVYYERASQSKDAVRFEHRLPRADGERWLAATVVSVGKGKSGRERFCYVAEDVTERKRAEERQTMLTNELNHRVKNTLAVVQAISQQTLRYAKEPEKFQAAFTSRIFALARVHDVLTRTQWSQAKLMEIAIATLAPYRDGRTSSFDISGDCDELFVPAELAVQLSLALNELATNAVKYGALSSESGQVALRWSAWQATGLIRLVWLESGGPPVSPPVRKGFGSKLLEGLTRMSGGEFEMAFEPAGLRVTFDLIVPDRPRLPASEASAPGH